MALTPKRRHYLAIFFLSFSLLILEIAVARILSVALLSHYAFVAVSLAMFGVGLSGLVVYLFPGHFRAERVDQQVVRYASRFGLTASLSVLAFLHLHVVQQLSVRGFLSLSVAYTILAVPFFFGGVGISLLMTHFSAHIGRIYYADLIGASCGCIAVVLGMHLLPAPQVALVAAAIAALAALLMTVFTPGQPRRPPIVAGVAVGLLLVLGLTTNLYTMRYVKRWTEFYSDYEVWNPFSRLSAFASEKFFGQGSNAASVVPLPQPSQKYVGGAFPKTMILDIDGAAWTPMMNYNGDLASIDFLRTSVLYSAHHVKPAADVLVIGTGGGRDLLAALAFRQKSVTGIEINPLMEHIVEQRFGDYSGHPYTRDGVHVIIDEARSRLSHLDRTFDILQLSLIDTFSLNAAGSFVFSENYLYTREAFQEYFRHLTPDGILTLTRYYVSTYPLEILRLIAMARAAWAAEGIDSVADRVVILSQGINATIMVKRSPWSPAELSHIDAVASGNNMRVLYSPGAERGDASIRTLVTTPALGEFLDAYPFLIDPPTDDRPFFFNFLRNRHVEVGSEPMNFLEQWRDALSLLYLLIAVVTVLALLFLVGPLFILGRAPDTRVRAAVAVPLLLYFACLGYGFMMIEVPLLQRFVLFLGYPVYALAVVLFALLLFSGTGSLVSTRFASRPRAALAAVLTTIIVIALGYAYLLPPLIAALLPLPIAVRIVVTVLLLAPIGLPLGMAYPLGITILREFGEGLVPWAWGLNGALSVVASVLAIFLGSRIGFTFAFGTGVAAYAAALLSMRIATGLGQTEVPGEGVATEPTIVSMSAGSR